MDISKTSEQLIIDELTSELSGMRQWIAELEVLELELRQSEELFRILFSSSPIGIYIVQNGCFRLVNRRLTRISGYDEDELVGMPSLGLVLPEDRNAVRENAVKILKGEHFSAYEFRMVTKRAEIKWVMETVAPLFYQRKRATLGNLIDITEDKQAEERLKQITSSSSYSGQGRIAR